jgi:carbon-monoxide dehydrogenase small subunit/xanthine dehydrogenase small subunit
MKITCVINGTLRVLDARPLDRLLDILRSMGLSGAKEGCGEGECGACAVLLDGELVNSCMIPAMQVHGRTVLTAEGLGSPENPDLLQRAYAEEGAVQCGFCIPGMVMASRALLARDPHPDRTVIRTGLAGNLCRCTGYEKIIRAVEKAAGMGYGEGIPPFAGPVCDYPPEFSEEERKSFFQPSSIAEAIEIRAEYGDEITFLAGTTDFYPDLKNDKVEVKKVLDLSRVEELRAITRKDGELFVGACASDSMIMEHPEVLSLFPALARAAELSGARAVQNRATLGGNLASASGAADLPVPLLVLGASVILRSVRGERRVPMEEFFAGYRKTVMKQDEILRGVSLPLPRGSLRQAFFKRGSRAALTLSRISVACSAVLEEGTLKDVRIAAGSMSAFPVRLPETEGYLSGKKLSCVLANEAADRTSREINPRTSGEFRKTVTGNLVRKFLLSLSPKEELNGR